MTRPAAVLLETTAGFVLADARDQLAVNPRPAVLAETARTHTVHAQADATTPHHIRSLTVALKAAQLTPPADATAHQVAAMLDASPARWAIDSTTTDDLLWRERARNGLRADLPLIRATLSQLDRDRSAVVEAVGQDITRASSETVAWLRARGVAADLETNDKGFTELKLPKALDVEEAARNCPELSIWPEARRISRDFQAYGPLAKHGRTGRFHPQILVNAARTGRMAVREPPLQGVRKDVRKCLLADEGHVLVSADYANAELRVAAAFIDDPAFTAAVLNGDIYQRLADHAGTDRKTAKVALIAALYGQGDSGRVQAYGPELAAALKAAIQRLLPQIPAWTAHVRGLAGSGAALETLYGRPLPRLERGKAFKAPNLLIQGTARDALGLGIRAVAAELGTASLWLPIHDELVLSVPEGTDARAVEVLREAFAVTLPGGLRLPAEPTVLGVTFAKPTTA